MILVIGLDGMDPDLVHRMQEGGRLRTLAMLGKAGWQGRLRSTFPPVSVPAWSTFLTGVGPGRHGLFDFTRLDGGRVRFQTGDDREVPTLLEIADLEGRRVCSLGIPTTYPVPRLRHGAVLAGFDSPFTGRPDERSVTPEVLWQRLRQEGLDLRPSVVPEARKGRGWHARASRAIAVSIRRRLAQALRLLEEGPWDLFMVHFQAADTAGHHFLRYFDASSPRHDASFPERARVLPEVYDALDDTVRRLLDAGSASDVLVLSDHGMRPASDRVCHLNRWLEEQGFLIRSEGLDWAGRLRQVAIRGLPPAVQAVMFRMLRGGAASWLETASRIGSVDVERSAAFSEESSTLPGVWVLDPARREDLIRRLRGWEAVVRVFRREDLYRGPSRERAPDLLLELRHSAVRTPRGYRGPSVRRLGPRELDGERGAGLNGVHGPEGILYAHGRCFPGSGELAGVGIEDLAPTLLAALEIPVPSWMEGRAWPAGSTLASESPLPSVARPETRGLAPHEEARLERRLRALGYLG